MRPPFQMKPGPRAFPMLCIWDSDIPSSCEMKDEPAVKPLQGNTAFFRVRASCCPFHLSQNNQGPSNMLIAERILLLMCLLKGGFPLESKTDNQLSSRDDLQYMEFSSCCYAERGVLNLGPCSGEIWCYLYEVYYLSCLTANVGWLWSQCCGIGPHLTARGKSHFFS